MTASLILKKLDTSPGFKATLTRTNPSTGAVEPIDITTAAALKLVFKQLVSGVPTGTARTFTLAPGGWGGTLATEKKEGKVSYEWAQADNVTVGEWAVEAEIEWPETGGVKRYETVPNEGWQAVAVIENLGTI